MSQNVSASSGSYARFCLRMSYWVKYPVNGVFGHAALKAWWPTVWRGLPKPNDEGDEQNVGN